MKTLLTEEEFTALTDNRREPHPICAMLRQLRQAAGLSLSQVEHQHGIPAVVVGAYERGDREPSIRKIEGVLSLYGYHLVAVPVGSAAIRLPTDIVTDLRCIADQLEARGDVSALPNAAVPED